MIILSSTFLAFRAWGHGREGIDGRERGKVGPVAQADNDNRGLARRVVWPPPPGPTLMRLKFMALLARVRSGFGVKLKN